MRNNFINIIILVSVVFSTGIGCISCSSKSFSGTPESVTFANLQLETSSLVYIAENQGYFSQNGINLTLQNYDTGVNAISAVLKGEADMAGPSEFVTVENILQHQQISILGVFDKSLTDYLICRNDRGINKATDLKGKRIGLARSTSGEFFLGRFLDLNGMNIGDVVVVDLPPTKWQDAIYSGDVDAVVAWAPYSLQIQKALNNQTINWQVQSGQAVFGTIVGTNDWIAKHPETIQRFLKSLNQAEQYLLLHPSEAKAIVQKQLNYDSSYLNSVWSQYTFTVSLDESLITAMEDETRWMIVNNLTTEKQIPNFLDYINENDLKAIKPEAVNIIR